MPASASSTHTLLAAFETHYAELIRYIARRTGNVEEARGLAHDTWLRIAERQSDGDTAATDPRAYLFTISHNVAMNHLRRGHWMAGYLAECEQIDAGAPAQTPDVADSAMYRQALAVVEKTLAGLSPRMRDTYLANGLHGEKQADIAARLGVSLNTVERDIAQAARCIEDALHAWRNPRAPARAASSAGRRKSLAALLGVFAVGVSGTAAWHHLQREALRFQTALATVRGRQLQRGLPDGSELTLDASSRVEVDYTAERRLVRLLDGAAFFAVQRDTDRPFIVEARGVQVTVLGTRFGVDIDGGQGVLVQVESGRVRVDTGDQTDELTAGQSLRAFEGRLRRDAIERPAAWRHGELQFHDMPLADALARVQRYSTTRLSATPAAGRLRISGELRVADAGDWLASLPRVLPVRIKTLADGGVEVAAR
ncbi:MAG: sigma-70 family RNA polymerase sigma factor [Comamonas sp.]|uniref:sigma-70 family RNA polymerase sigma factor n=1 Tax=Comamonas sp. TaxID=34028 RepID=UPI002FCA0EE0